MFYLNAEFLCSYGYFDSWQTLVFLIHTCTMS